MTGRLELILGISVLTLALTMFIAWLLLKRDGRVDRSIDAARAQLYETGQNNDRAHETMQQELKKVSGRLQVLTARTIAEELAAKKKDEKDR